MCDSKAIIFYNYLLNTIKLVNADVYVAETSVKEK